jgi:hypothetical protein
MDFRKETPIRGCRVWIWWPMEKEEAAAKPIDMWVAQSIGGLALVGMMTPPPHS